MQYLQQIAYPWISHSLQMMNRRKREHGIERKHEKRREERN
jgi:hypothetical protein